MGNVLRPALRAMFISVVCWALQCPVYSETTKMIDIPNADLAHRGKGWALSSQGKWLPDAGHQGDNCAMIKSDIDAKLARCVLLTPPLPSLQPGMEVRVAFYAKWRAGDNHVFVTFQEDDPYWLFEHPLWESSIPTDGQWHHLQADIKVPQFLHRETTLKLCIGHPYTLRRAGEDPQEREYLIDDISIQVLKPGKPVKPTRPVVPSFVKDDPRDEASPYGVYWTPWKAYCRTVLSGPHDRDKTPNEIRAELDLMQQIGIKWIRSVWRWDKLEWEQGAFDVEFLDMVVAEAWKRDIRIVPALTSPPRWASPAPEGDPDYTIFPPKMPDWNNFVSRTVDHFKGRVKYWEVWNEPNIQHRWNGTIGDYFELQKATFIAARRADPHCKLLMGSFSGAPAYFLDGLLRLGAADYFDILSYHPYPRKDGLKKVDYLTRRIRVVLAEYGCEDRPIWFTEIGCKGINAGGPEARAQLLSDLYRHPFGGAVEKRFWFTFDIWSKRADGIGHGLIDTSGDTVQLCPAYHAYGKATGKNASVK